MSNISRSVYQKLKEENKRLLEDIKVLTGEVCAEKIIVTERWRNKFSQDKKLRKQLQSFAKEYLKEHPEFDITSPKYKSKLKKK